VGLSETRVEETDEKNRNFPTAQLAQHLFQLTHSGAATRGASSTVSTTVLEKEAERQRKDLLPRCLTSVVPPPRTITTAKSRSYRDVRAPPAYLSSGRVAEKHQGFFGSWDHITCARVPSKREFGWSFCSRVDTQDLRCLAAGASSYCTATVQDTHPVPHTTPANSNATFAFVCDWKRQCE
jgi:hypothetical protein